MTRRDDLFAGPGEIRVLCRSLDWGATPLGPVEGWPAALRTAVRLCLESRSTVAVWAGPGYTLVHNEGYVPVLGPKYPGALGRPLREVWPEVLDRIEDDFDQVARHGASRRYDEALFRIRREGGDEDAYFTYSLTPIRDDDGRVVGIFNALEEITRAVLDRTRREATQAFLLRLSDALRAVRDPAALRSVAARAVGRHLRVSAAGYADVEPDGDTAFAGGEFRDRRLPHARGPLRLSDFGAFADVIRRGEELFVEDAETDPRGAGGGRDALRALRTRSGAVVPFVHEGRLVTCLYALHARPRAWSAQERLVLREVAERTFAAVERARAEDALREADRRKDHFLAMLSHELRNPLAPIKNSVYVLQHAAPGGEPARRATEIIARQVDQLAHIVDDLLDVTRISRGKVQLQRGPLELNGLVQRTVDDLRGVLDAAGLELRLRLAPRPVTIDADWNRVAQVLGNLLQNAAKFTPHGGRVTVTVEVDGPGAGAADARQAVVRVADTGAGMPPEMLAHLFEPFIQADRTLHRSAGGLGLGLALVKGLVEQHGGTVEAHSAGLGHGAEFVVRFPVLRADEASPAPAPAGGAAGSGRCRILVVEDNVDAAESLQELLRLAGHEVAVAYDGPQGVAQARALRPDVVFCDLGLPGLDGFEVARALRGDPAACGTRLVALSGYALPDDVRRAAEAGFERHVAKPATLEKLIDALVGLAPSR